MDRSNNIMKKLFAAVLLLSMSFAKLAAQSDTLHIYYQGLYTKILDSNETKIGKWAKSLNGKKVDVQVLAYYNDKEFKKYSQERADELFLILNRKARDVINITSIGPAKGQKSQRSKADIVYTVQGQPAAVNVVPAEKPPKTDVSKTTEKQNTEKDEPKKGEPRKRDKDVISKNKSKAPAPEVKETITLPPVSQNSNNGNPDELNSAPTTTISDGEPLKVMVNGEWVEYKNGKKVKTKKK